MTITRSESQLLNQNDNSSLRMTTPRLLETLTCHSERSEESRSFLRFAQNDNSSIRITTPQSE